MTNYSSLSKDELYLISRAEFEKQKLITTEFTRKLFIDSKKAANILDKLTRKGRLLQLERGKYILVPLKAPHQLWAPNEFVVAKLLMGNTPYYIGYYTMYHYWGFTEQVPQTIFILNTNKSGAKIVGNIKYQTVKIDEKKYYGVQEIQIENENICISDKERTLVDFIYHPIGSFANIETILKNNLDHINLKKFIQYLILFPVVSVRKRAGYLLEKLDCPDSILLKLKKTLGNKTTYTVLDPSNPSRKGKIKREWKIIVNK